MKLKGDDDRHLHRILFKDGKAIDRAAMFFTTGCVQRSDLWQTLGPAVAINRALLKDEGLG